MSLEAITNHLSAKQAGLKNKIPPVEDWNLNTAVKWIFKLKLMAIGFITELFSNEPTSLSYSLQY
jgi:hypothetical protein